MADISKNEITELGLENLLQHYMRRKRLFVSRANVTLSNGNYKRKFLFRNPSAANINAICLGIWITPDLAAATSQLNQIDARLHHQTTVTDNGSSIGEKNLWLGEADANCRATYDPTCSNNGTAISERSAINNTIHFPGFILSSGDNILLRLRVNDANNGAFITIIWAEDDE